MVFAYLRVSTNRQNLENQKFEITRFAENKDIKIDSWVEETVSGTVNFNDRELGQLLSDVRKGDRIIVAELSRLGRSLFDVMSMLNHAMEKEVTLYSVKENYELGATVSSKILAFAFSLSAEIERQLISQRTKEALQRRKAEGKSLGRPRGYRLERVKLSGKEERIRELLSYGVSLRAISRMFGVHHNTVSRFISNKKLKI